MGFHLLGIFRIDESFGSDSIPLNLVPQSLVNCGFFVNGVWIGSVEKENISSTMKTLWDYRKVELIPFDVSIFHDPIDNEIHIHSDAGRMMRPVFNLREKSVGEIRDLLDNYSGTDYWKYCEDQNIILWVDSYEVDFAVIATDLTDAITRSDKVDFSEIHPSLMLGTCANLIPFPEHSQAPRNVYISAMMKQGIGLYTSNFRQRCDTSAHVLHYPQKRLVNTKYEHAFRMDENPCGTNAIVAIACYTGFNMEDSVILNKSAIDRGMFRSTSYRTVSASEVKRGTHGCDIIEVPEERLQNTTWDYSKLDSDGIVCVGEYVDTKTVLVGRSYYSHEVAERDVSMLCGKAEVGIVESVCVTLNAQEYKHVKIKIRSNRIPEVGDKVVSSSAQKGWR